ncbi:MAG: glycosyltransferase [Armatimonadota bacterium]|nr:glycosyltransferase [Armatimonadota bacterium]
MIWIVLPAYNEAGNLPALGEGIARTMNGLGQPYRVVMVDDGSTDGTRSVAAALSARLPIRVLGHDHNHGLPAALLAAFRWVLPLAGQDDAIVTMDADNTQPPELIPGMVAALERGADVVVASRYVAGADQLGVPVLRRILSRGARILLAVRFGLRGVRDYSSGFRMYRARLLQAAVERYGSSLIATRGFAVMPELLVKLSVFHPKIAEVPLRLRYDRKQGRSKIRLARTIVEYLRLLVRPGVAPASAQGDRHG